MSYPATATPRVVPSDNIRSATVRFAGDSGDGMQLAGMQFTNTSAVFGNDIATLPDFPAEIRAPAGTLAGVSGFQINFSRDDIHTAGDKVDALIAMNPAALKANLGDLNDGGMLIVNNDEFGKSNLAKAGYKDDPLETELVAPYRLYKVPITTHTLEAVKETGLGKKDAERCKNFYALGLVFWLYERPLETTLGWIARKFAKKPDVADANTLALKAGHSFGETAEMFAVRYRVDPATLPPGKYRSITGNQALAIGLTTAATKASKKLFYCGYPITPASDILHELSAMKHYGVRTLQMEDEIAAAAAAIGASFAGEIGVTGSSGPGIALKQEAIGLAVMTELPLVIINVQRAGPSTGMPTKVEQADLLQAVMGRNGEAPAAVLAPMSPGDCFWMAIEAVRIATKYMCPVFVLSDGYLANSSEPWLIPDPDSIPAIEIRHAAADEPYKAYGRNEHGGRPWAIPGTPELMHRIGGIEKDEHGNISYDARNHQKMTDERQAKIDGIARDIPPAEVHGDPEGDLLVVGWGGTYGALRAAVNRAREAGKRVSHLHLRYIRPFPRNLAEIFPKFKQVLVPELNLGQLQTLLRAKYLVNAIGMHKVQGRPFMVSELEHKINELVP